ncbi:MAG TPA: TetR/AcrR family transcriptional regulator C-terminal domain-containing protein [Candidatus Limnocylindria bacterium]|jgi:AcrR family transcriptional regulator
MATRARAVANTRHPLSKERVLRRAIALADRGGIEALSMRKLAEELGVEAMSLYHYVANKDDLLDGITDIVASEIEVPSARGDWKSAVRRSAISFHDALARHPWACSLMMSNGVGPARLRYMESLLQRLRQAGFSPQLTHHAYHALDSHIIGFTLWAAGYTTAMKGDPKAAETFLKRVPVDEFPYFLEHADEHMTPGKRDGVSEFEFGLGLILDGLEKIRKTA